MDFPGKETLLPNGKLAKTSGLDLELVLGDANAYCATELGTSGPCDDGYRRMKIAMLP